MSIARTFFHYFPTPLPYVQTLALQEKIHQIQLKQRRESGNHKDILLLLQHRPVYTAGRRQTEDSVQDERKRLTDLGADFVITPRGGQLTYHGPGQLVGYPLIDLSRTKPPMAIRDYVCALQRMIKTHLQHSHGIKAIESDDTGVFVSPTEKISSIGVQVRHRLTNHGFALNYTREPLAWFNQVVACGLENVKATSIETSSQTAAAIENDIAGLVARFGSTFNREMTKLDVHDGDAIGTAILELEASANAMGAWPTGP